MTFDDRLKKAISRGQEHGSTRREIEDRELLSADALKNRHNEFRLKLSEHIETSVRRLEEHFPGFKFETLFGDRGWGGAVFRDDITRDKTGKSGSFYSRLEVTVRPLSEFNVLNVTGKGTIYNKEEFSWNFFKDLPEVVLDEFKEKVDSWILVYAEKFASL